MARFDYTILQVVPALNAGGAERTTLEVAAAVVHAGGRALVATHGGRLAEDIRLAGGEIITMPVHSKNPVAMWANAGRLAALIGERGVDLIHARSRAPAWSAYFAAQRAGVPFVTTYHGAYRSGGPIKRLYNSSMLRGDIVIANSRYTGEQIERLGKIDPARLRVIPRGADLKAFDPARVSERRRRDLAKKWGDLNDDGKLRILAPGRIVPWKGHQVLIDALGRVKSRSPSGKTPDLTVVICGGVQGSSSYYKALRALVEERGVRSMVHFVGDCADMPAAYAWADVVIAASARPEAFGRVAVEAGAMNKPVIASNHGGFTESVIDGESGLLITPGDSEALAAAIEQMALMAPEARAMMGEKGNARAKSVYSAAAMCDATLSVYSELLGAKETA